MNKFSVTFIEYPYNRYSIAAITGAIENDERLSSIDIHFLSSKERKKNNASSPDDFINNIIELSKTYEKNIVAFSFHTPNIIEVSLFVQILRKALQFQGISNVFLIAGGPHPSGDPIGTLELGIDYVFIGEGENSIVDFLYSFFYKPEEKFITKGLAYLSDRGEYVFTGKPIMSNLSNFPPFAIKHRKFSPIEISRGCPWACSYCQTPFLMGGKMRHRSIDNITKYAEIAKISGIKDLRFITPISLAYGSEDGKTLQLDIVEELLSSVSKIFTTEHVFFGSFPSEVRPENISYESLALIKKYCANRNIIIGAQSGSNDILKSIHRGHTSEDVIAATEMTIKEGFTANIDFIFGLPGETNKDIEDTIRLMKYLIKMGARIHSHTFMPLVGTPFSLCPPGKVNDTTKKLIESLRGKGIEYGDWELQEQNAATTTKFLYSQFQNRNSILKDLNPYVCTIK